jgi:hypothetical protein
MATTTISSSVSSQVSGSQTQAIRTYELNKTLYKDDQQEKFMHLQAEVDTLLQQLQSIKQQRQTSNY